MTLIDEDRPPEDPDDFTIDPVAEPFRIENDASAAWAMRKLRRAQAEVQRVKHAAGAERLRLTHWEGDSLVAPNRDIEFFTAALVDYRHRLEAADPDLPKTYKVVGGSITRRKAPDKVEVTDEQAFVTWALTNAPEALSAPTPLVSTLKGDGYDTTADGEIVRLEFGDAVPGVRLVPGVDQYAAKPDKEATP